MIYFIQCGTNGPIKIGYTDNGVKERLAQLQTGCPYELMVLWVYTGDDYTEAQIHSELSQERVRGEWFHPSKTVIEFITTEMSNVLEIESKNGRWIQLSETFSGSDEIILDSGIRGDCPPDSWVEIDHRYGGGEIHIRQPKTVKNITVGKI